MASEGIFIHRTQLGILRREYRFDSLDQTAPASLQRSTVNSAARTYVTHYTYAGGSDEALALLETLVTITPQERERIMSTKEEKAKKATKVTAAKAEKPTKEKVVKAAKEPKAAQPTGEKRQRTGAAATFKELIMKGKQTDEQIFEAVRARHPEVTPDKRHYVSWYRNALKKEGANPPSAIKGGE
jgi:hypothetical protein